MRVWVLTLSLCLLVTPSWGQGTLENPSPNSHQSGLGLISGWYCNASKIEVVVDNTITVQAAYGTPRGDTQGVCGDSNNGFGVLVNWNDLGSGSHTIQALADGQVFGQVTITVTTLGTSFLRGQSGRYTLLFGGKQLLLEWNESLQNFVIAEVQSPPQPDCDPSYPTVCIPSPPPDLDCKDIPYHNFPVRPPDPHHFDGDGDGIGCEQ